MAQILGDSGATVKWRRPMPPPPRDPEQAEIDVLRRHRDADQDGYALIRTVRSSAEPRVASIRQQRSRRLPARTDNVRSLPVSISISENPSNRATRAPWRHARASIDSVMSEPKRHFGGVSSEAVAETRPMRPVAVGVLCHVAPHVSRGVEAATFSPPCL